MSVTATWSRTFFWVRAFCIRRMRAETSSTSVSRWRMNERNGGTEAGPQQSYAVKLPQPLAVQNVALAPAHVVDVAGVDQHYFETALLEDFVERDPVHPGRFHRHGLDSTVGEPIGQPLKVGREGAELAHRFSVAVGRDRHEVAILSAIDPNRIRLDAFE